MTKEKVTNNKEKCLETLDHVIAQALELKAEVEKSDDPNISVICGLANEETFQVRGAVYGTARELTTTLSTVLHDYQEVIMLTSILAMRMK